MPTLRQCLISMCLLLYGCGMGNTIDELKNYVSGGEDNTTPPTPLEDFIPRTKVINVWQQDIGEGAGETFLKLSPGISPNKIFVAEHGGDIKALDSSNGKQLWSTDADTPISGGPGYGDTQIYVGTSEGEVLAYSISEGKQVWRTRVSSEVLATPREANNIVVIRTIDGKIHGLNSADGTTLWNYDRSAPVLTLRGTSAPVIEGNAVIAGFDGGKLVAIDLYTGKLLWETSIAIGRGQTDLERMVDIDAEPLILEGIIYVSTFQGGIAAVDFDSGGILWTRDIASHAGMSADRNNLYITDDNSHVWAIDLINGSSIWKQEKLEGRAVTAPANIDQLVVVGDLEGYLHWMEKDSGEFVARTRLTDAQIIAPPATMNEVVYVYASNGKFGAYTHGQAIIRKQTVTEAVTETENNPDIVSEDNAIEPVTEQSSSPPQEVVEKEEESSFFSKVLDIFTGDDCEGDDSDLCD